MNIPYQIYVGGSKSEIKRVLTALFERGYVFDRHMRLRNYVDVTTRWPYSQSDWNYIIIGNDDDCKALLMAFHNSGPYQCITLDDFLKLKR